MKIYRAIEGLEHELKVPGICAGEGRLRNLGTRFLPQRCTLVLKGRIFR